MKNNSKKYMKMKQIMIWMILAVGLLVGACHQTTVGYLLTCLLYTSDAADE